MKNAKSIFKTSQILFALSVICTWAFGLIGLIVFVIIRAIHNSSSKKKLSPGQNLIVPSHPIMNSIGQVSMHFAAFQLIDYDDIEIVVPAILFLVIGFTLYIVSYKGSISKSNSHSAGVSTFQPLSEKNAFTDSIAFLRQLSRNYGLNFTESDLNEIFLSDDLLFTLASKIKPGYPTVDEACMEISKFIYDIMSYMNVSELEAFQIQFQFTEDSTRFTDDTIREIANNFSEHVPANMFFLKCKINYELAALGYIMQFATDNNNKILQNKVTQYRRERGFIS